MSGHAPERPPVWLDGTLVAADEARLSVFDHGLTVGDGVFETLRVYGGTPFAVRRHVDRLEHSAASLGLPLPDRGLIEKAMREVVAASGLADARVRLTVTAGPGPMGSGRSEDAGDVTVLAVVAPLAPLLPAVDVVVVPWTRNEGGVLAGVKSTSYAENVAALAEAHRRGADEAIFGNTKGRLCEGTGTNVVVALDGRLLTPPLSSGCLAGITRALVLEVAGVQEADLPLSALAGAEEAFLTSSTREVQPIRAVDGRALPGAPGPLTRQAAAAFHALVTSNLDP